MDSYGLLWSFVLGWISYSLKLRLLWTPMDSPELFELVSTHPRTLTLMDSYELNLLAASIIKIFTSTLDSNELL